MAQKPIQQRQKDGQNPSINYGICIWPKQTVINLAEKQAEVFGRLFGHQAQLVIPRPD